MFRTLLIITAFILSASFVNAQKKLTEGTISYDVVINTGSDKPQSADLLDGAISTIYIKGNKTHTEMVSSLGTQSTIIDGTKRSVVVLKSYGDQKYMINMTADDWKAENKKYENVTFTFDPSATKTILGYQCKKAVGQLADGTTFTAWYTPDLVIESKEFIYPERSLPGLAMEYETTMGNLKVTYTVSKLSFSPVPGAKFDLPKSGFRIMSYKESKGGN
jgi:GLPGLI family protein